MQIHLGNMGPNGSREGASDDEVAFSAKNR